MRFNFSVAAAAAAALDGSATRACFLRQLFFIDFAATDGYFHSVI